MLVDLEQRKSFPRTDEVVVSYIAGLVEDEDEEVDDIVEAARGMLQGGPSDKDMQVLDNLWVQRMSLKGQSLT